VKLCGFIAAHLPGSSAVLDGKIVCLDQHGRSQFYELMFRRGQPFFYAFDLLWLNGEESAKPTVLERKARLHKPGRILASTASFTINRSLKCSALQAFFTSSSVITSRSVPAAPALPIRNASRSELSR